MLAKILLVEDEKNFGSVLKEYLKMNGYVVELCEDGELGLNAFKSDTFDLCILDIMMPKKDGFTLGKAIKAMNKNTPIIFLTARTMREDMILGYQIGADDYIHKPFDSELLLFKIKVILNRNSSGRLPEHLIYKIGQFEFNAQTRLLRHDKKKQIQLSPKESALLDLLCQHQNSVLLRERALKDIWQDSNYFTGRSMDVYIVKLRKYLSEDPSIQITNLHGNGYRLAIATNESF
jgi:two-component system, OmpR family, response regulator